jgi:hypothetical protein
MAQRQHPKPCDFIGYDGDARWRALDWRWSVFAICPAIPGITTGYEHDPKEARRKVKTAWRLAKEKGWRDP